MAALTAHMGFFQKKPDPISERSRQLTAKIAELENKIKRLNQQAEPSDPRRLRSTAYPPGAPAAARPARQGEPVFERVDQKPIKDAPQPPSPPIHIHDLGARKLHVMGLLERIKRHFRGPPAAANPKLLSYLAAGNIQGLRPLRYEKRVARNRFVALALVLVIVLFGLFCFLARKH
jgi:hypothetical protein